ncbi:hypothetical protein L195_g039091 [Trifolium pratense]|uniref:Receptor-like kinase n=1 Tax=Trifolium pratense TaxID=57577 RepID=A0A2K3LX04_TRIPR|nr:hypothetical protein L195_g039091 [Trifolium pratense]
MNAHISSLNLESPQMPNSQLMLILHKRFKRLFDLAENKSASVAEMFMQGWGSGGEVWAWRRQLRAWEEELLGECQSLLLTISLQDHVLDRWHWQPDQDGGYTVCGAYQLLMTQDIYRYFGCCGGSYLAPSGSFEGVYLRLATPAGHVESAHHLFFSCSTFGALWSLVSYWIGSPLVTPQAPSDHFVQFTASAGGLRARSSFMQLIWLACVWVVWTERNYE